MASNFNNTTPAAAAGSKNVTWQTDGAGNDSAAYIAPADFFAFAAGKPTLNEIFLRLAILRACKFPASATNSYAVASAASGTLGTFTLSKNGTPFATVNYTASATGVFTQASDATFAAGDVLEVQCTTADVSNTLSDVGISLY